MITLVTGGARSGKSSYGEAIYEGLEDVVYIATSTVEDSEMEDRVALHRDQRPSIWRTFEAYRNLDEAVGEEKNYLLDCVTVMTSNIMFEISKDSERISREMQGQIEDEIVGELLSLIEVINKNQYNLVLVTNEVGDSIVPDHHISRVFRDIQGRVNQKIAAMADSCYLVCCGLPVKLK